MNITTNEIKAAERARSAALERIRDAEEHERNAHRDVARLQAEVARLEAVAEAEELEAARAGATSDTSALREAADRHKATLRHFPQTIRARRRVITERSAAYARVLLEHAPGLIAALERDAAAEVERRVARREPIRRLEAEEAADMADIEGRWREVLVAHPHFSGADIPVSRADDEVIRPRRLPTEPDDWTVANADLDDLASPKLAPSIEKVWRQRLAEIRARQDESRGGRHLGSVRV